MIIVPLRYKTSKVSLVPATYRTVLFLTPEKTLKIVSFLLGRGQRSSTVGHLRMTSSYSRSCLLCRLKAGLNSMLLQTLCSLCSTPQHLLPPQCHVLHVLTYWCSSTDEVLLCFVCCHGLYKIQIENLSPPNDDELCLRREYYQSLTGYCTIS